MAIKWDISIVHLMKTRGIKPLYDARPVELVHELRRQMCGNWDFDKYYHNEKKKRAVPVATDEVGIDILEKRRISCVEPGATRKVNG